MSVRLAHLSDVHFGGENAPAARGAIAAVRAFQPDVVVVTGDVTLNGLPREFEAARAWLDQLPAPVLVTPGNHDTPYWNLPMRALVPFRRFRRSIGPSDRAAFDGAGVSVRCLNSARGAQPRPDWSKGAINLGRLMDAIGEFAARPDALRVFACHHPLVELDGAPVTGGVHRGAAAAAALSHGGVDLILTGHVHNPFAVVLPFGDRRTYAVGAGTLSVRTRGTPPSLSLITADAERVKVEAIGWTGAGFEPYQAWILPRRSGGAVHEESPAAPGTTSGAASSLD